MYPVIFLSLLVFWGLIFLFIGIGISSNMKKKTKQCTVITSATVLRNLQEKYRDIDHNTTYTFHPVLEYFVNEGRIEAKYTIGTAKVKYIEGQKVNILYNPNKPTMFYIEGDKSQNLIGKIFKIVGIICICTAIVSGIIVTIAINEIL